MMIRMTKLMSLMNSLAPCVLQLKLASALFYDARDGAVLRKMLLRLSREQATNVMALMPFLDGVPNLAMDGQTLLEAEEMSLEVHSPFSTKQISVLQEEKTFVD